MADVLNQARRPAQSIPILHILIENTTYFLSPTDLFLSLRSEALHFLHLSAVKAFLAPHLRHILRNSLLFCAICFFVASVMGKAFVSSHEVVFNLSLLRQAKVFQRVFLQPVPLHPQVLLSSIPLFRSFRIL